MDFQEARLKSGKLYIAQDPRFAQANRRKYRLLDKINALPGEAIDERMALFRELFGSMGEGSYVEPPFYCDYGSNIHVGKNFYMNAGGTILDVVDVTIGDDVFIGPNVGIYPPYHPTVASIRNKALEGGKPITIGSNVWIGGGATICPDVTIGTNVVIGAGAVVTKDIPDNSVAVGVPARVIHTLDDTDEQHWKAEEDDYLAAKKAWIDRYGSLEADGQLD
jgi:maltose O-acetyltransferase